MITMLLQDALYSLGIIMAIIAIILGILGWRNLSEAWRKMREAQAEGQHISWYTYPPTLINMGILQFSPATLLLAITMFLASFELEILILKLVLTLIALLVIGTSLFFIFRGRRLLNQTGSIQ